MSRGVYLSVAGFGLIAVCYGFARFAFGLFLPQIDAELSLSPTQSGLISGGSFFGYCIAIVLSAQLTERMGARAVAIGAALVAAVGMVGIATAESPWWLAAAVMFAGSSTGLASPPMAAAVAEVIQPARQAAINTVINSGTSAGVVLSGPAALLVAGQWRLAFAAFAGAALVVGLAVARSVPGATRKGTKTADSASLFTPAIQRLIVASFLLGMSSTAIWSFGSQLVTLRLDWDHVGGGLLWTVIGAAGIAGAAAGALVARFGIDKVHWASLGAMAMGILAVGTSITTPVATFVGGALFGAAYIMLSGVYLVWGVVALPARPATGLMIGFLTLAIGQTVGAPIFGLLMGWLPADAAVIVFAALALGAGSARAGGGARQPSRPAPTGGASTCLDH
ncbi:MAG: MFS transporter [Verrucomicrobiota bacterium JB022]|nr:MFS transporter [Verrucomicrobiota bacterium JB022]